MHSCYILPIYLYVRYIPLCYIDLQYLNVILHAFKVSNREPPPPPPGGGGGGTHPKFWLVCAAAKWKMGPGSGTSSRSIVKMRGSGTSLSRFELENAGLLNELDPFWAWKCESPELPGRVWLALWPAANPRRCRPWEAINGLKLKEVWKLWSPERQNPPQKK